MCILFSAAFKKQTNPLNLTRKKIAGVTVLFYPDQMLADRIFTYLNQLDVLYIVDNSEVSSQDMLGLLTNHPKIKYIHNQENLGIAKALNIAANFALLDEYDFLLTMDQDSSFEKDQFEVFVEYLNRLDVTKVGILSPRHLHPNAKQHKPEVEIHRAKIVMTSGNLVNLLIFRKVGNFLTPLFIDHVDHEYCLRLRMNGYEVLVMENILLNHSLGSLLKVKLFNLTLFQFVSHQPIRTYYMIRNGLYVALRYKKEFPDFYRQSIVLAMKEIIKVPFEKDKLIRIRLIILAIKHYTTSSLGKLTFMKNLTN